MTKITIEAGEEAVNVRGRNTFNGNDGQVTKVEAGGKATIDVDASNEVVISLAVVKDHTSSATVPIAEVVQAEQPAADADQADAPTLRDGSDEEINAVLADLNAKEDASRTTKGYLDVEGVNAALAEQGLNPISAQRRTELSDAGGFVKAPA